MFHHSLDANSDREGIHSASYSEKYFDGDRMDASHNKNVEWLRYPAFWWLYLGALPFLVLLLELTVMEGKELGEVLTVTHIIHNTVRLFVATLRFNGSSRVDRSIHRSTEWLRFDRSTGVGRSTMR
jgi:hypothetical protein